jgi:LuxR family maltose regulon positive regulatory protein
MEGGPGGVLLAAASLRRLAQAEFGPLLAAADQALLRAWSISVADAQQDPDEPAPAHSATPAPGRACGRGRGAALTARELEVLERIAAGDSNKLIARRFDLSLHTVKRHVANILGKLGVETRGQAAAFVTSGVREPFGLARAPEVE